MDEEVVCYGCVEDQTLQRQIKKNGSSIECSFCNKRRKSISVASLAEQVADILDEHYVPGGWVPRWRNSDSDRPDYHQRGESLEYIVGEVLLADNIDPVVQAVCSELGSAYGGDEPRYSDEINYVGRRVRPIVAETNWGAFRQDLMHGRRFFNDSAKQYLQWLFKDMDSIASSGELGNSVVRTLSPAEHPPIFRARRCDSNKEYEAILFNPPKELGAAPKEIVNAGRMNPHGVPVFYGAFERDTCIAELRPPVGGRVISGEFRLTKGVRLLDFKALERALETEIWSYFKPGVTQRLERREFLRGLHKKVSIPVLPGQEHEYLSTQILAEFLATLHEPPIDGVIFSSAQFKDGLNVVLFSHVVANPTPLTTLRVLHPPELSDLEPSDQVRIEFVEESVRVHQVQGLTYVAPPLTLKEIDLARYDTLYDEDDEWD
ncbi:RES family NAD+ phosphorylase [Pseudomonas anguilliseptica]|uniref:RES family NAD+ phosphorylase n=1 Tax=Pseudomonas anguilliseptica TaxID=53406 RepID=UPI00325A5D95